MEAYREVNPEQTVRAIVAKAISDLEQVGMGYQNALSLLMIQAVIRMDAPRVREAVRWLAEQARYVEGEDA